MEGTTQAIFAWRHVEHGDCLSQRTLRERHTRQLRNLGARAGADTGILSEAGDLAFFSEFKAEAPALALFGENASDPVTASPCDMLYSENLRYDTGLLVLILSSSLLMSTMDHEEADTRCLSAKPAKVLQASDRR